MMMKLHAHGDDDVESRGELIAKKILRVVREFVAPSPKMTLGPATMLHSELSISPT
jgi:hypothetical protein